jgi:hypothetical protein
VYISSTDTTPNKITKNTVVSFDRESIKGRLDAVIACPTNTWISLLPVNFSHWSRVTRERNASLSLSEKSFLLAKTHESERQKNWEFYASKK